MRPKSVNNLQTNSSLGAVTKINNYNANRDYPVGSVVAGSRNNNNFI